MPRKFANLDFSKIAAPDRVVVGVRLDDVDDENLAIQEFEEDDTIRLQREIDENLDHNGYITTAK